MPYLDYILLLLLSGLFCFPTESLSTLLLPFVIKSLGSELFNNSLSLTLDPLPFFFFFFQVLFIFGCAGSSLLQAHRLSLVAESRGYSLVVACRLLIVMASFIVFKELAQ